jgi:site-specific DNA recombinase
LMLTGAYTPRNILKIATHEWGLRTVKRKRIGGTQLSLSGVYRILTNPFYAGILQREGKTYPGKHVAMVTIEEFDHVQRLLGRPHQPRSKLHEFAFTGIIRCGECGLSITAEERTQRHGHRYTYYRCTKRRLDYHCQQPHVQLPELEQQIIQFLEETTIPERLHNWAIARLKRLTERDATTRVRQRRSLEEAHVASQKELSNLTKLRIRDLLTDEEYAAQRQELERDQIRMAQNLEKASEDDNRFEPAQTLVSFSNHAASWFKAGDLRTKRLIFKIIGSNPVLRDKKLSIDAKKPFRRWPGTASYSAVCSFVKDVRTRTMSGELESTLAAIREVTSRMEKLDVH